MNKVKINQKHGKDCIPLKVFLDEDFDLVVLVEAPGRVLALLPGVLGEHRGNRDSTLSYNTKEIHN